MKRHACNSICGAAVIVLVFSLFGQSPRVHASFIPRDATSASTSSAVLPSSSTSRRRNGTLPLVEHTLTPFTQSAKHREHLFRLKPQAGEHVCCEGFSSTLGPRGWCTGEHQRNDTVDRKVGDTRTWYTGPAPWVDTGSESGTVSTELIYTSHLVRAWARPEAGHQARHILATVARNLDNPDDLASLRPPQGGGSILNATCTQLGTLPFIWTCSPYIHLVMHKCAPDTWSQSAGVYSNPLDLWNSMFTRRSWIDHPIATSNGDMVVYLCEAHVMQYKTPEQFLPLGGLTAFIGEQVATLISCGWGALPPLDQAGYARYWGAHGLGLAPLPYWDSAMQGSRTFHMNDELAMYFFKPSNPSLDLYKYQLMYTYLTRFTSETTNMMAGLGTRGQVFLPSHNTSQLHSILQQAPMALELFNVFLTDDASAKVPITPNVDSYFDMMSDFFVAWVTSCLRPGSKPTQSLYHFPDDIDDMWLWDCTSFPTFNDISTTESLAYRETIDLPLLGASVRRFEGVSDPVVAIDQQDPGTRLFVIAEPAAADIGAPLAAARVEDVGLQKYNKVSFTGDYGQLLVVALNVDPRLIYANDNGTHRDNLMARPVFDIGNARPYPFDPQRAIFDRSQRHASVLRQLSWSLNVTSTPYSAWSHTLVSPGQPVATPGPASTTVPTPPALTLHPFRLNSWAMIKVAYTPQYTQVITSITIPIDRFVTGIQGLTIGIFKDIEDIYDGCLANVTINLRPEWAQLGHAAFYQTFDFRGKNVIILKDKPVYITLTPLESGAQNRSDPNSCYLTVMMRNRTSSPLPSAPLSRSWLFPDYDRFKSESVLLETNLAMHMYVDEMILKPECGAFTSPALCEYAADYVPPAPSLHCKWEVDVEGNIGCLSDFSAGRSHGNHDALPLGIIMLMALGGGILFFGLIALWARWHKGHLKRQGLLEDSQELLDVPAAVPRARPRPRGNTGSRGRRSTSARGGGGRGGGHGGGGHAHATAAADAGPGTARFRDDGSEHGHSHTSASSKSQHSSKSHASHGSHTHGAGDDDDDDHEGDVPYRAMDRV